MDFIERLFGFSPDGGSGIFELMLFAIPIAGIVMILAWRRSRASSRRSAEHHRIPSSSSDELMPEQNRAAHRADDTRARGG